MGVDVGGGQKTRKNDVFLLFFSHFSCFLVIFGVFGDLGGGGGGGYFWENIHSTSLRRTRDSLKQNNILHLHF